MQYTSPAVRSRQFHLQSALGDLDEAFVDRVAGAAEAARIEAEALADLADRLWDDVAEWLRLAHALQSAVAAPDLERSARLILECVFDELLAPPALRVLDAFLSLAALER